MKATKGFTIIELLIVIVIIGILVAITAVSYTGITNGANTANAQSNARAVRQLVTACQAKTGSYPADVAAVTACQSTTGISLPAGVTVQATALTTTTGKTAVRFTSGNPPQVQYYDFSSNTEVNLP